MSEVHKGGLFGPAHKSFTIYMWEHTKQALSWQACKNLTELRNNLKQVLDSLSTEAIASLCGWHYIVSAVLSATS